MARANSTTEIQISRKLCEEASALRDTSKLIIADAKEALARSRAIQARIEKRRRSKKY